MTNPEGVLPETVPFNIPYGQPISSERAQSVIEAAIGEATKRGWPINVAVVDSGGNLVAFRRMDTAQTTSTNAVRKARVAVQYRRPTRFFDTELRRGVIYILTLEGIIAGPGGVPLTDSNGWIIGGVGCSGGTGDQDEVIANAGASALNR